MNKIDQFLEEFSEFNPEALYPTDMKHAVIGYMERFGMEPLILLDREKCIKGLMKDGMSYEEANEFFEFNTIGSWVGKGTPCFATLLKPERKSNGRKIKKTPRATKKRS